MASMQKRGENSWLLVVESGYNAKGDRARRTKTVRVEDKALLKTKKKLQDYLDGELYKFRIEVEAGEYISPEKMLFSAFVEEWRKKYLIKEFSQTTINQYNSLLKNHILPAFGHIRIDKFNTMQIINLFSQLREKGSRKDGRGETLSDRTISHVYRVLKKLFDKAEEWNVIKDNPIKKVSKPKFEEKEMEYYEGEEARFVILALEKEEIMWKLFFLGAMLGGLRRGELIALQWSDIDFETLCISIDKNIPLTENGEPIIKKPKTKKSIRIVDMPEWYMEDLKRYKLAWKQTKLCLGNHWEGGDKEYIFHGGKGKPLFHTTPTTKWRRFIDKNNLKYIRLHDLRHTMVTLLIEAGTNMKAIQKRAGHSSVKVTSDIYGHITKKVSRATADQFNKFDPNRFVNNSSTIDKNGS
ncbi:site-specific integrase [Neobacillus sp.]|uniref:tyrosine-type recombinase/integrase n=1 Tax=Neobacillus sp. TaxID=2675273 RepID=UPI0028A0ED76|nr:site-specific integrase [Neobacillus sp.]